MKKNKNDFWGINLIAVLILILIIIVTFGVNSYLNQKIDFKITKEECWNESIYIGEQVKFTINRTHSQRISNHTGEISHLYRHLWEDGYHSEFYENTEVIPLRLYEKWDCSEYRVWWEGDIRKEQRKERICYRNLSLDSFEIDGNKESGSWTIFPLNYFDFPIYFEFKSIETFYEPFYEYKQICEPKEVDEICLKDIKICTNVTFDNGTKGELCFIPSYINNCQEKIQKQDLSIEWLEENAECIYYRGLSQFRWDCENAFQIITTPIKEAPYQNCSYMGIEEDIKETLECSKYKYKDYIIEVIQ